VGQDVMAVLAKIVFEESPRASSFAAGVPPSLDDLVARMMAKDPAARPRDGADVAAELAALDEVDRPAQTLEMRRPALTPREQRLLGVILVRGELLSRAFVTATLSVSEAASRREALQESAKRYDARLEVLADGTVAATVIGAGAATDQAAQAARC